MKYEPFDLAAVQADDRPAQKSQLFDPLLKGPWRGHILGDALGAQSTVLAYGTDVVGEGPPLHIHPYDELFIVVKGRARFFVGEEIIDAEAGDVVLGPKGLPHRFENLGPGRLQTLDIHHGGRWFQINL